METWVIGDVHGCFRTLERLVARLPGQARRRLLMVGDLVNRGPSSLEVLRWAARQPSLVATLGNHDLHLMARAAGLGTPLPGDTLDEVLEAPDRDELLDWLRRQPLLHRENDTVVVHAGVCPTWSPEQAAQLADSASQELTRGSGLRLLKGFLRAQQDGWHCTDGAESSDGHVVSVLSGIRTLLPGGEPCRAHTGPPEAAPEGCRPWFTMLRPSWRGLTVFFGHWAALGFERREGVAGLDSGCVYGHRLTAVRVEDGVVIQEPLADGDRALMDAAPAESAP